MDSDSIVDRLRAEASEHEKFYPSDTLHGMLREAAAEIDRLQKIVSQLPKTKNGAPILLGMRIWFIEEGEIYDDLVDAFYTIDNLLFVGLRSPPELEPHECYSTYEEAKKDRDRRKPNYDNY